MRSYAAKVKMKMGVQVFTGKQPTQAQTASYDRNKKCGKLWQ